MTIRNGIPVFYIKKFVIKNYWFRERDRLMVYFIRWISCGIKEKLLVERYYNCKLFGNAIKLIVVAKMCSTRPSKVLVIRPRNITTDRSDGDSSSGDLPFEIIEEINGHNELHSFREVG